VLAPLGGNAAFPCNAAGDTFKQPRIGFIISSGMSQRLNPTRRAFDTDSMIPPDFLLASDLAEEKFLNCIEVAVFNNNEKYSPSARPF